MSRFTGTIFDPKLPNVVRVSRIGTVIIMTMILMIHGMLLAI